MINRFLLLALSLITLSSVFVALTPAVSAVDTINTVCNNPAAAKRPAFCSDNNTNGQNPLFGPTGLITRVVQILTIIVGVLAVFTIMLAGFRMITSSGDPGTISTSRNAILYALIGLVIVAISQLIVTFVLAKIGT